MLEKKIKRKIDEFHSKDGDEMRNFLTAMLTKLCVCTQVQTQKFKIIIVHAMKLVQGINIGMYLHGFEKRMLRDINKRSSLGERCEQAEA